MVFSPAFGQVQVFVTSQGTDGNLGGQAGADSFCTNAAVSAGHSGTWTAWVGPGSGSGQEAKDRILDAQYVLTNSIVVADSLAELTSGTLQNPINVDEFLLPAGGVNVWTGVDADGNSSSGPGTCQVWSSGDSGFQGRIGLSNATGESWTDSSGGDPNMGGNDCDTLNRLYCFADVQIPVEMEEASVE
jgi:hypothetical protein